MIWSQNGAILHGLNAGAFDSGSLVFPVSFPGETEDPLTVTLQSSAQLSATFDILSQVRFYLTGDASDLSIVQGTGPLWAASTRRPVRR